MNVFYSLGLEVLGLLDLHAVSPSTHKKKNTVLNYAISEGNLQVQSKVLCLKLRSH